MNRELSFVVFGAEWGGHPNSTQHIVDRLARTNPVLYVNTIGLRSPSWCLNDLRHAWRKLRSRTNGNGRGNGSPNGHPYSPLMLPFNGSYTIRRWNARALVGGLRREMGVRGIQSPILFASSPMGAEVVGQINEALLVYYITDQYREWPRAYRGYVDELERVLLDRADVILVTSVALQRDKKGKKTQPVLLSHGVDFRHFHAAVDPLGPMPKEIERLPRPLLGFFGLLAPWVDFELLKHLARAFPRGSVVLIGPKWGDCQLPKSVPNLHWLGPRCYDELPRYGAHFDVGLIPFRGDRLTAYVNPLKLLEYLALGLPVVSTPLPDFFDSSLVFQARGPDEFVDQVELALAGGIDERREQRYALAAAESWETRVTVIQGLMEEALKSHRL